jgi:hypothetical protein
VSSGDVGELLDEEYVKEYVKSRVREILDNLVVRMNSVMRGYLGAVQATIMRYYGFKPVMEVTSSIFEYGVEYHITMYIDPKDVKRIEEIARRELEGKHIRIRALRKILAQELKSTSGEVSALLSNMHRGSGEGVEKAGGGGTKTLGKKRRSADEGSNKSAI